MEDFKYLIEYQEQSIKDLQIFDKILQKKIIEVIDDRLIYLPHKFGKPLQFSFRNHYRLRIGKYRVIYKIDNKSKIVFIVKIGIRKNVYN